MSKVTFDALGNPFPYEIVQMDLPECEKFYVDDFDTSTTRDLNWKKYRVYLNDLQDYLMDPLTQWFAGSFTTNKLDPSDIDLVNFINISNYNPALNMFNMDEINQYPKKKYNIDGYNVFIVPDSHRLYAKMMQQKKYWMDFFGSDRDDNPKAIIEVQL